MIFLLLSYFLGLIVIIFTLNKRKNKFSDYPKLIVTSFGISFHSNSRHRLRIDDAVFMQMGNMIYLKKGKNLVIIKNVDKIFRKEEYLYFTALGKVLIFTDTKDIYKYFNIYICTHRLEFFALKQRAIRDMLNNVFDINQSKYVNSYMKLLKMLNITFTKDKLVVGPNKLHLPFTLIYKLNHKIKRININDEF